MSDKQQLPPKAGSGNKTVLALLSISLFISCSNCVCLTYFNPPMQWYNYSYDPAPNVTIGINLYTLGPQPVTVLDSGSGKINFSTYSYYSGPVLKDKRNGSDLDIYLWLPGTDTVTTGITVDTYVYLPRGPNYTLNVWNMGSPVVSKYTGGNLTMWANDQDHHPRTPYPNVTYYPNGTWGETV